MPKAKRGKKISLTKTKRRSTLESKNELISKVRDCVETHKYLYLLSISNQKNVYMKGIRTKNSRLFCSKNKVMQVALGVQPESEIRDNIHHIAKRLSGQKSLLFSDEGPEAILKFFDVFKPQEFARPGVLATVTVSLERGSDRLHEFQHTMEPLFRDLGLPTAIKHGKIELLGNKTICEAGQPLSTEAAHLLKHLGIKMSRFSVKVLAVWDKDDGSVKELEVEDI